MNSLQRFDQDGIEIIINTETGESFASVSGYARMSGKDKSTISRRMQSVAKNEAKTAEIQTTTGFKTVALIPESLIAQWLPNDNPEMAGKLMLLGVRVFMHKMAGYEVTSTATEKVPTKFSEALLLAAKLQEEKELLEEQQRILEEENERLAETVDELYSYSSVIRVAKFNNIPEKTFNWRRLAAASNKLGVEIKKVPCPRFVTKNLYSHDAWRVAYPGYSLPETTTITIQEV